MALQEVKEDFQPRFLLKTDQGQWRADSKKELTEFLRKNFGARQFLYAEIQDTHLNKVVLNIDRHGMAQWTDDSFKEFKGAAELQETPEYHKFLAEQQYLAQQKSAADPD